MVLGERGRSPYEDRPRSALTTEPGFQDSSDNRHGTADEQGTKPHRSSSQETGRSGGTAKGLALDDGATVGERAIVKAGGLGNATQKQTSGVLPGLSRAAAQRLAMTY